MIYTRAYNQRIIKVSNDEYLLETGYLVECGAAALDLATPTYKSFMTVTDALVEAYCNKLQADRLGLSIIRFYGGIGCV